MSVWRSLEKLKQVAEHLRNETTKVRYMKNFETESDQMQIKGHGIPVILREHMDMAMTMGMRTKKMEDIQIQEEEVIQCIRKLKNKTTAGPDGLKPELYKAMSTNEVCILGCQ